MSDALDNAIWAVNSAQTSVNIPTPTGQLRMVLTGNLPESSTDSTNMLCAVMQGENLLFRCAASVSWQGQSSMADPKHNFKLKLTNEESGDDFYVKVGSWVPQKKFVMKAYGQGPTSNYGNSDRSMTRDTTAAKLWRSIRHSRPYPESLIAPLEAWAWDQTSLSGSNSGALFSTEGFPCSLYIGDVFYGLYVFRSDAPNSDYLIDKTNPAHFLLQPEHIAGTGTGSWFDLQTTGWKISSPKMKKYVDQQDISQDFPKQYAIINRLFTYFGNVYSGSDSLSNASEYINVNSWLDYIIFCQVAGSGDAWLNNVNLVSWDATKTSGIWHVCAYDLDETFGIVFGSHAQSSASIPEKMGFTYGSSENYSGIFYSLAVYFDSQIKTRYSELRSSGVVSNENLARMLFESTNLMNSDDVQADYEAWGTNDQASVAYILDWTARRIAWLDEQWGYTSK